MTPSQAQELLRLLKGKALTLDDLHERVRVSGSAWSVDQLHLFLLCARGVQCDASTQTFRVVADGKEDALFNAIVEAVRSFGGKPVPASQVRARLPNEFITTDEQVLAIARRTEVLEVFGPKLIRIAN
jgi:hypothetical protein